MFKQLVTNTTAGLIALAVAPANVSKNLGKRISRRTISFSLHTVAVLAMALTFQGLTTAPAGAGTFTACLEEGKLKRVARGFLPLKPCGDEATQVSWDGVGGASVCPCDIRGAVGLAGWDGPGCVVVPPFGVTVEVLLTALDGFPRVDVFADPGGFGECSIINDVFVTLGGIEIGPEDQADCFADVDDLAFTLGVVGGCMVP